jgi:hypothetical protein
VILPGTKFPSVFRFQFNAQQWVKAVRLPGNDSYGKEWAVAVQIGTALM